MVKVPQGPHPQNFDTLNQHYALTPYETSLLDNNGFVVSSRLSRQTFLDAFTDIYNHDLPVYVSSDAILHAIHMSYDAMSMEHGTVAHDSLAGYVIDADAYTRAGACFPLRLEQRHVHRTQRFRRVSDCSQKITRQANQSRLPGE